MEPLFEASRTDVCSAHGPFEARNFIGTHWTRCPTCAEVAAAKREEEERVQARIAADRRRRQMLEAAQVPARYHGRGFDDYVAEAPDQVHALTVVRDYIERFDEMASKGMGLGLIGLPGTGKTHLACAALQARLPGAAVLYSTAMDLIRMVRETWRRDGGETETQVLRRLERLDLLVIDEVGTQNGTENEQHIIFDVLDRRYREVRPTILVSNQNKTGLKQFLGERSFDRLAETCRLVVFDWGSFRPTVRRQAAAMDQAGS